MVERIRGYAEGYYGRLLTWSERGDLLDALARNKQNTYYYAPKEDVLHRLNWRIPYEQSWLEYFTQFTTAAAHRNIDVVAGVAPGLDFNFQDLPDGEDFRALLGKCQSLLDAGAHHLSLLMDDIDADFAKRCGKFSREGEAHASLANALSDKLGRPLWVTPRIYANELVESAPDYLADFLHLLGAENTVLYCGTDVVAHQASVQSIHDVVTSCSQRLVLWDNLYANDYCPRRLFIGPWVGRPAEQHILLNPTGMLKTDELLLALVASVDSLDDEDVVSVWKAVLRDHGVPEPFFSIAEYFYHPVFNGVQPPLPTQPAVTVLDAIEECLWRWKSPLSREWYPALFGLKHDVLIALKDLPDLRIQKTQNDALSRFLLTPKTI